MSEIAPIVFLHGIAASCPYSSWTDEIARITGAFTKCIEVGDGVNDSETETMEIQVMQACQGIKNDPDFANK